MTESPLGRTGPQILVVNAGSSSLKYAMVDSATGRRGASGIVERIGERDSLIRHEAVGDTPELRVAGPVADHRAAFASARTRLDQVGADPHAVGHRVVHGGATFTAPAVVDDEVVAAIEEVVPLAPLHNPPALAGIAGARAEFPDITHVAVFDTAFHTTIPDAARLYAIDRAIAERFRLQRYGFHGTSHRYVARQAADFLGRAPDSVNVITLHLGNGASACAVRAGHSVDTSMGVTPLEGLVMGTRTGDLDPSVPLLLVRHGMSPEEVDDLLNRSSGLKGVCGDNDMREIHRRVAAGDPEAALAREMFVHRIRKYLGAYLVDLGHTDAIVFTAGIGENDAWVRDRVCADLTSLGIQLDPEANAAPALDSGVRQISAVTSPIAVLVVPTDEERAIAAATAELLV